MKRTLRELPEPKSPVLPLNPQLMETVLGAGQSQYKPLPALRFEDDTGTVITRWQFTWKEVLRLLFTRTLWISSLTYGNKFHPINLHLDEPQIIEEIIDIDPDPQPHYGRQSHEED